MKNRTNKKRDGQVTPQAAFRMDEQMFARLERVAAVSRRSRTSVIEECIEKVLPELEKQYSKAA